MEAVKLKLAVKKEQAVIETEKAVEKVYQNFLRFVGRVEVTFEDDSVQVGNAVLVWKNGYAVTPYHVCKREGSPNPGTVQKSSRAATARKHVEKPARKSLRERNTKSAAKSLMERNTNLPVLQLTKGKRKSVKGKGRRNAEIKEIKVSKLLYIVCS